MINFNNYLRHFILWIFFTVLLPTGFLILQNVEGYKVTAEPMLSNLLIFIEGLVYAIIIYPVTFFLLAVLIQWFFNHSSVKMLLYCVVGGSIGGFFIYPIIFPPAWEQRYHLNVTVAIVIFGIVGLIYAFVDIYTYKKLTLNTEIKRGAKIGLAIICLISLTIIGYNNYSKYTYNMHAHEQGILYKNTMSPDKNYIAKAYGFPYGGAMGGVNVRVDILSTNGNYKKTIYYAQLYDDFRISWIDNKTLTIKNLSDSRKGPNRSITLNIFKQIYDEKGTACKSFVLKGQYKKCFQY